MGDLGRGVFALATAIVGVAIVAVLVSQNSNTSTVVGAFGDAFAKALQTAVSPVSGGSNATGS